MKTLVRPGINLKIRVTRKRQPNECTVFGHPANQPHENVNYSYGPASLIDVKELCGLTHEELGLLVEILAAPFMGPKAEELGIEVLP